MKIEEKYRKISDKSVENTEKIAISDESYAICEFLEELSKKIELWGLRVR